MCWSGSFFFFFSSRRRHTRSLRDWSSDVCSSDLADPSGTQVLGTFGNCAGGETPWGTYLTAEENIQDYFGNFEQLKARNDVDPHIVESHRRWRLWKTHSLYSWEAVDARFDLPRTPNEPFRFGWIVE